jgi:murein endopeptidase
VGRREDGVAGAGARDRRDQQRLPRRRGDAAADRQGVPGHEDRAWLHRVRPWWGHDHHFHLRLACPGDSPDCVAQDPLPPGDGCNELAWWFDESAQAERAEQRKAYQGRVGAKPPLPDACAAVLSR